MYIYWLIERKEEQNGIEYNQIIYIYIYIIITTHLQQDLKHIQKYTIQTAYARDVH